MRAFEEGGDLVFTVRDNGAGMDAQQVKRLRQAIHHSAAGQAEGNGSFGLASINRRIRLLYGEDYGIGIDSSLGQYSVVKLKLPIQQAMREGGTA